MIQFNSQHNTTHYFLTGGTGILGTEIVPRLLAKSPGCQVTLLVRCSETSGTESRLREVLDYVGHWWPGLDLSRVNAVRGDIVEPALGLSPEDISGLRNSVTHIIHSAASIQLTIDLDEGRRINVDGTRKVAELAASCPNLERFLPISTAYVAGRRAGRIMENELDKGQEFVNDYERSKYESELQMGSMMKSLPITIVRPGIIVGNSSDGHVASFQNMYVPLFFVGSGAVKNVPGDVRTPLDIVPVDYVADVIVETLHCPACVGRTYHACSGEGRLIRFTELARSASVALARLRARRLRSGSTAGAKATETTLVKQLMCFFDYLAQSKVFDTSDLRRDLGGRAPRRPEPIVFLPRLMQFWQDTGYGKRMPWIAAERSLVSAQVAQERGAES
jgi:thioester reductase-like protein